jgi:lysophospholipase L1-like esterase
LPLVPRERLPDGIHPDDAGHAALARTLGGALHAALEGAKHA